MYIFICSIYTYIYIYIYKNVPLYHESPLRSTPIRARRRRRPGAQGGAITWYTIIHYSILRNTMSYYMLQAYVMICYIILYNMVLRGSHLSLCLRVCVVLFFWSFFVLSRIGAQMAWQIWPQMPLADQTMTPKRLRMILFLRHRLADTQTMTRFRRKH